MSNKHESTRDDRMLVLSQPPLCGRMSSWYFGGLQHDAATGKVLHQPESCSLVNTSNGCIDPQWDFRTRNAEDIDAQIVIPRR